MVGYMPQWLPDELLYSFLGRMSALNCMGSPRERMHLLFGAPNVIPVTDLPTRLEFLQSELGPSSPWTSPSQIINQATIYPYHRPFLTLERHTAVENIMFGASGKSLKTLVGRVANRFGASPELRFCPVCSVDDTNKFGAPYWHCTHQLPGVTVCSIHRVLLRSYSKNFQTTDRQRIVLAPGVFNTDKQTTEPGAQQIAFASLSAELLTARLPVLEGPIYQHIYRDAVLRLGFKHKRYVDYRALTEAVRSHYGDFNGFPHRERLLSSERSPLNWLRALIERPQCSSHPICHLLLIGFAFETVEGFIRALMFATGSADRDRDANCASECERKSAAMAASMDERRDQPPSSDQGHIENLALSCREAARLTGCSVTTVVKKRRVLGLAISERPKTRCPDLIALIKALLEEKNSPQQIAKRSGTSLSTVYRAIAQFPDLIQRQYSERFDEEREMRRESWTEMLAAGRSAGLTNIRRAAAATYAWLYRNDRQWLQESSECFHIHRHALTRVDWAARDDELCLLVSSHVNQVRRQSKRPRLSRTLMTRSVGDATVRANIGRLPKLKALIDELEESIFSYQCVRINSAVMTSAAIGQPILDWKIRRMAGIRCWLPEHSAYVVTIVKSFTISK